MKRKNIVLLGIGHTNAHVVKEWIQNPIPDCKLICISKFSTATYSGMLPGTLARQFSDDEMRIDLRNLADRAGATLILADTCGLDRQAGQLHFFNRDPLSFDALSVGVGSMPVGWQQQADSRLLVPIKPMQTFIARLQDCLKRSASKHPRVAIVGGGVAGVEIAFCLQERYRKQGAGCSLAIDIFTSGDRVADGMSKRSVRRIEKLLAERDIHVVSGQRVTKVSDSFLLTEDGTRYTVDCVVWATGAAAPPVLAKLGLQTDDRGFIATSNTLQSISDPRIFAVGDSGTAVENPSPKAGVYAVRQAPILWHNLNALFNNAPMKEFRPQNDFLKILNTGEGKALLEYKWLCFHARWCMTMKTWIDKKFIESYQLEAGIAPGSPARTK